MKFMDILPVCRVIFLFSILFTILICQEKNAPGWSVNPADFECNMNIISSVLINDNISSGENNILASFYDNECRGLVNPIEFNGDWLYFLIVYANNNGEILNFRFYDAGIDSIGEIDESLIFNADQIVGSIDNPLIFTGDYVSMGDLNSDSFVDILDIVELVFVILEQIPMSDHHLIVGDFDYDGELDIVDLVMIVDVVLNN